MSDDDKVLLQVAAQTVDGLTRAFAARGQYYGYNEREKETYVACLRLIEEAANNRLLSLVDPLA